jgi:hypothetical protein
MYDVNYVIELRKRMHLDLENLIQQGSTIESAKSEVLNSTRLAINPEAKKILIKNFKSLQIGDLSIQTAKAAKVFDRYPEFRAKRRLPGILERVRSLFFS